MNTKYVLTGLTMFALTLASCSTAAQVGELRAESQAVALGDDSSVRVEIEMGAGNLQVTGGANQLLEADFVYNVARLEPEVTYGDGTLVVRQPNAHGLPALQGITDFHNEWSLRLSNAVPMDLSVDLGAGAGNLELADLSLTGLDVSLGAGEYTIDLTGNWTHDLEITMNTGAANITLKLPAQVGVRVEVEPGPSIVNTTGFTQDGNLYTNAAYGDSDVRMQINMEPGIGQINLETVDEHAQAKAQLQSLRLSK